MNQDEPKPITGNPASPGTGAVELHKSSIYELELDMQNEELRRVQEELETSKAKYFDLYDTATVGFCEIGRNGIIRQANQTAALLLQTACHDLVRSSFIDFIHPEDLLVYRRLCRQIEEKGAGKPCELRLKQCGELPLWVDLRGAWNIDINGIGEMRFAFSDISSRKTLEAQFRQAQKMQAFGQLAGGVAHDFNNIIATILMQVDVLNLKPGHSTEQSQGLEQIREDALRAAELTRQLLTFSRKQIPKFLELDLNEITGKLAKMSQRMVGDHISLEVCLAPKALVTLADAAMLDQLMMNLLGNAVDAMPGGGKIHVETAEQTLTDEEAREIPDGRHGRYVTLTIKDNGCGMPPEILSQIFEPFFTTKEEGKGTGLGLATVYSIVLQHQGLLAVTSETGQGTSFRIFLPASEEQVVTPVAIPLARPKSTGGGETILLVEDQASLRKLTGLLLEARGYRVLYAADGVEALEVGERHPGRIDLLLTDLQMPRNIGGLELADRLSTIYEDLRVLFVSGGTVVTNGDGFGLSAKRIFLAKPIQPRVLLEVIRTCLDS